MNICHIITRMIIGGAQENTVLSCRGLAERGHRVTLVTGPTRGPEGRLLDTHSDREPFQTLEAKSLVRALNPPADCRAYRQVRRILREGDFDVVHTHSSKAGILGRLAAWRLGVPVVVHTVHGQAFHPYQSRWRNRLYIALERSAARRCHHIFAVAQAMVDQCVAAGIADRDFYSVVYSGMDLEPYIRAERDLEMRARLGIPDDAVVVGKIARLFELKGHDALLSAVPRLAESVPSLRVLLVGDGDQRAELERMASELGIAERVVFAGLVPPSDIPSYVAQMDVLAHFSLREGLPRAVVQALAAGVPAVAYELDGTPEVVQTGQTGILCPPLDRVAAENALLALLRNPEARRKMGANGRARVRTRFDWRTMVESLERQYERLR